MPDGESPRSAILLIPGSLFADVNGDYPEWRSFPGANVSLAHQLSQRGHAVFRFAKPGPGTGTVVKNQVEWARHQTWDGRVTIALAAFEAMGTQLADRTPGSKAPSIVSGHSEGAVVALRLAQLVESAGVITLGGPSTGILSIMREQNERIHPPDKAAVILPAIDQVIGAIRTGQPIPEDLKQIEGVGGLAMMPPSALTYMRESDATDPVLEASRLTVPLLVVQGTGDSNVPAHHGRALAAANPDRAELVEIEGLSHFFKLVPAGTDPMAAFGWPGPCDARVADRIDGWVRRLGPA
jgi:alpha-beta hydrolase superfamily lysophospholipase